jgi:hypothetical protein
MKTIEHILRVQDDEGRGPFKPGFSRFWLDPDWSSELPTWMEEFGRDVMPQVSKYHYGCGVRSFSQLARWFSDKEVKAMYFYGYSIVSMRVDEIIAESKNQNVFRRRLPLNVDVTLIPLKNYLNPGALIKPA